MRLARFGPHGGEIPVVSDGDGWYDLRSVTTDVDGEFLAGDGPARARQRVVAA
jgi:hypothetical protein